MKEFILVKKITKDISKKVPQSSTVEEMKELLLSDNDFRILEDIKQNNDILFNEFLNLNIC